MASSLSASFNVSVPLVVGGGVDAADVACARIRFNSDAARSDVDADRLGGIDAQPQG